MPGVKIAVVNPDSKQFCANTDLGEVRSIVVVIAVLVVDVIVKFFRGCLWQPLYCFHLDFRCVTLVRYIYIYIYICIYIYIYIYIYYIIISSKT